MGNKMVKQIAVIGLGRMGGGIARNLAAEGSFDVTVFDRSHEATKRCVDAGAKPSSTVTEAISEADLVITSLPTPEIVLEVVLAGNENSKQDSIWMDVSTIDPATATDLAKTVGDSGRRFVACPLGKGPAQADEGTLPLFVGCDPELLEPLKPVFTCIGESVHYMGEPAAACAFKVVSNMVGMANLAVLAEGYALCSRLGVNAEAFTSALQDTGAWSNQAVLRLPWMIEGDFTNRFAVDLAVKDVRLAVDAAARSKVPVPVGAAGLMQLISASNEGWGSEDVDAVLKVVDTSARN